MSRMNDVLLLAFAKGLLISGSMIIAIGAQNAFVLRVGLQRMHVLPVILTCAFCDAALICLGIAGAGALVTNNPGLVRVVSYFGAAYLAWFGVSALKRAYRGESGLAAGEAVVQSLPRVMLATAGFTLLNPHVYIDTLVTIGSIGARESGLTRPAFTAGAITASITWFTALGFGARLLQPLFARPSAWRILDTLIALTMFLIAGSLVVTTLTRAGG